MRDTQHSPASPGDKLKKGQMAQGQESSVKRKRKGQDQTVSVGCTELHIVSVEEKQRHPILSL